VPQISHTTAYCRQQLCIRVKTRMLSTKTIWCIPYKAAGQHFHKLSQRWWLSYTEISANYHATVTRCQSPAKPQHPEHEHKMIKM